MADHADHIQQAVAATIRDEMGGLRSFVDRRIAELSAEIHATVQLVDFSETNLSGQLGEIRKQIAGVIAAPRRQRATAGWNWRPWSRPPKRRRTGSWRPPKPSATGCAKAATMPRRSMW